eukprot:CAMPEP_0204643648 /NCGR_PEP_ID=MMETSP0718-20130828/873_1 /ASSEMBLY_ACC=CAM_ASM_000674 /TAXON_ID=230516 /ORGANISM="Chaetoceros curvisetus" /LENGTH=142 /DNA_ID=CAMNT_0051664943 /DNA_START=19 /DNA_END=447 /DNA_ORIENTATION=+
MTHITNIVLAAAIASISLTQAFVPVSTHSSFLSSTHHHTTVTSTGPLKGYLDNYTAELYTNDNTPDINTDHRDANVMNTREKDRFGPGSWEGYVEFDSFDGGDAQMGVVGDGSYTDAMNDFGSVGEVVRPRTLHSGKNGCWR